MEGPRRLRRRIATDPAFRTATVIEGHFGRKRRGSAGSRRRDDEPPPSSRQERPAVEPLGPGWDDQHDRPQNRSGSPSAAARAHRVAEGHRRPQRQRQGGSAARIAVPRWRSPVGPASRKATHRSRPRPAWPPRRPGARRGGGMENRRPVVICTTTASIGCRWPAPAQRRQFWNMAGTVVRHQLNAGIVEFWFKGPAIRQRHVEARAASGWG